MQRVLLFLILALFLASCGSSREGSANLAHLYDPQKMALRPHYRLLHQNDSLSILQFRVPSRELLYQRQLEEGGFEAQFQLRWALVHSLNDAAPIDSGKLKVVDFSESLKNKTLTGEVQIRHRRSFDQPEKENFILYLNLIDLNRQSSFSNFINFSREGINAKAYFSLEDTAGRAIYKDHLPPGVAFQLKHPLEPSHYYARLYTREFPLALPPYAKSAEKSFELKPDSNLKLVTEQPLRLPQKGLYHFLIDSNQWQGYSILSISPHFPMVGSYRDMAEPLRYITTQREYEALQAVLDDPEALRTWVENFWLLRAGSRDRARELIARYYGRVEEANRLFSSYQEGWKTDRGILYVIYGPPAQVFRNDREEDWVYGNDNSSLSFYFRFRKMKNPFSDNDYELERQDFYRYGWGQGVESWRSGRVFGNKEIRRLQDEQDQLQYRSRNPVWY